MSATAIAPRPVNHPQALVVQLGDGGFLQRVERKVRLLFGVDLYAAVKGDPKLTDKVQPFQPGYMKLVAAMGGDLLCPPVTRDPVSGQPVANPQVVCYPGTDLIKSVRATAVCVVPNPQTGKLHPSVQTITLDAEFVLRQALLKIEQEEVVRLLSQEDVDAEKAAGKLVGWTVYPVTPPHVFLAANLRKAGVRDAIQTLQNLSGTIRQRACSKAERLAADHNPVLRWTTTYGDLLRDLEVDGRRVDGVAIADTDTVTANAKKWAVVSPVYAEFECISWVRHEDRSEVDAMLARLATEHTASGTAAVVIGGTVDVSADLVSESEQLQLEGSDDLDDSMQRIRPRDLELVRGDGASELQQRRAATATPVVPAATQAATSDAASKPAAAATTTPRTGRDALLVAVRAVEEEVVAVRGSAALLEATQALGHGPDVDFADLSDAQLRALRAHLATLL